MTTVEAPAPSPAKTHKVRQTISWILVVLAALFVGIGTVAVWASRTIVNEDRFTSLVSNVVSDEGVITAASSYITDQVQLAVQSSGVLDNLPPALQTAANVVSGAVLGRVEERVNDVLASDTGQRLLLGAVTVAHRQAMKLLQGDGLLSSSAFTIENGTVTLNLIPVIRQVLIQLQQDGLFPTSINIPTDVNTPGPIQQALGGRLPPNFGQIVVYQTDNASGDLLDTAQRSLVLAKRGVVLLVVLAVVCCVAAVLVAVDRRRAVFRVGAGIVIASVLLIIVVRRVAGRLPDVTNTAGGKAVASALGDAFKSSLTRALVIVAVLAAIAAVGAMYFNQLRAWTRGHQDIATIIVVALGLVILLVLGLSWASVIFALIVAVGGVVAIRLDSKPAETPSPVSR